MLACVQRRVYCYFLKLLSEIKQDVPKGNTSYSKGVWLRMNCIRVLISDLKIWNGFVVAALKTL